MITQTKLQIHDVELVDGIVNVNYTLVDDDGTANVPFYQICQTKLTDFIEDNGLNDCYSDDSYYHLNANIYLHDNLHRVVTLYLEDQFND